VRVRLRQPAFLFGQINLMWSLMFIVQITNDPNNKLLRIGKDKVFYQLEAFLHVDALVLTSSARSTRDHFDDFMLSLL
jgi:hypothetical protein